MYKEIDIGVTNGRKYFSCGPSKPLRAMQKILFRQSGKARFREVDLTRIEKNKGQPNNSDESDIK